ncbi:homoserine O-succinyltransferase [uncultured Anaerococcus sp.]|uniref:homoserine O-succinyltransferase n=1 Tax=uncultured Anaerococcus sp. TaxID=293428 RepID=UPI0026012810|nr:homoserine O-succinyltransferase [uncultured Anaerococcus sp.]
MPVIIPKNLIDKDVLDRENIFIMDTDRAESQDIRPLKIGIVNLMPTKEKTEIQLLRLLSNNPLQIDVDLIDMDSYKSNHSQDHLEKFYTSYENIKNKKYDGLIITGAPLEQKSYKEIKYWQELTKIFDFAKTNVFSTLFICWGAIAALDYYYGVEIDLLDRKLFEVHEYYKNSNDKLLLGFDDVFYMPNSRYKTIKEEEISKISDLNQLVGDNEMGASIIKSVDDKFIFNLNHIEYDKETLDEEYRRDIKNGLATPPAKHYYQDDNPDKRIIQRWKSTGYIFFNNWLNYYVYQTTPFDSEKI